MITSAATTIDLSSLPAPQAVEQIRYEQILADMLADLRQRDPAYNTLSEADPAYKILEVCAYREAMLRQRENNKTRSLMLAFATGSDLDHLGVTYFNGTARLVLQAAAPQATPPLPLVLESDDDYRNRLLLQPEGESVAGPEGSYVFHTLSAHPDVADASAHSPWPAGVVITLLGRSGPLPSAAAVAAVAAELRASLVLPLPDSPIPAAKDLPEPERYTSGGLRPVADRVILRPATLVQYRIEADITTPTGPDSSLIGKQIAANLIAYKDAPRRLGRDVAKSAIYAALHVAGVERVDLIAPAKDLMLDGTQASVCTGITVRINSIKIDV